MHALTAQVFVVDAAASQVALGQAGQAMRLVHFEHVALQHGVVGIALDLDAMVREHMAVVFDVLAQLLFSAVLEPRLEPGKNLVPWQLRRCVGVVVGQWNVGSLARLDAEADADDLGAHRVQRSGFGVDGYQIGGFDPGQPAVEKLPAQDRVIGEVAGRLCLRHRVQRRCIGFGKQIAVVAGTGNALLLFAFGDQFRRDCMGFKRPDQALEAVLFVEDFEFVDLLVTDGDAVERRQAGHVPCQVAIGADRHQPAALW